MEEDFKTLRKQFEALTSSMNKLAGEKKELLFREFALAYMEAKLRDLTLRESTRRSFECQVRGHLIPAFGALPIEKVNNAEWLYWVTEKKKDAEGRPPGRGRMTRFFNARKYLMEILIAAKEDGHVEKLPRLSNPDESRNVGRVLEDREILRILRHTKKRIFRFFFFVLWKMGCRPREILKWEWDMIRWGEPGKTWIDIPARISKTVRHRSIPINPSVSRRLYAEFTHGVTSKFVFPNVKDPSRPQLSYHGAWATACKRAGIKVKAMPYDMRRTFITEKAADNQPMIYVAKTLDTSTKMIESTYAKAQAQVMENIVSGKKKQT